jgi:membrane associated rhomboid family serine protease/Zn-finger nucleic acid-binding protein
VMKCPSCSNRLRQTKTKSAFVDVCPSCKGIWFDAGELADFVKTLAESEDICPEKIKLFHHRDVRSVYNGQEKNRSCPRCAKELQRFNYSYDSNVFLDKCPDCGGIWADGGEVRQIASYLKDDPKVTAIGRDLAEMIQASQDLESDKSFLDYFVFFPKIVVPISDDIPRQKFPFVTVLLIVLCMFVFLGQMLWVSEPESFVEKFGFVPAHFFSIGLISYMFLHTGVLHLAFNMLFLWLFGDNVEDQFGHFGYLSFCLVCGLFAVFLHGFFNWGSSTPVIGSSGFISGIMGAYLIFYPAANVKLLFIYRTVEVPVILYLGGWFVLQMAAAYSANEVTSGVAWFAHIGGFIFGVIVAFLKKISG